MGNGMDKIIGEFIYIQVCITMLTVKIDFFLTKNRWHLCGNHKR